MAKHPVLTHDNVIIQRARPRGGWHVQWPASKRGRSIYRRWFPARKEAATFAAELIIGRTS